MKRHIIKRGYRFYPFVKNLHRIALENPFFFGTEEEYYRKHGNIKKEMLWSNLCF